LAQAPADEERLTLVIAGRRWQGREPLRTPAAPAAEPATFDRDGDVEQQLREIAPDIVVSTRPDRFNPTARIPPGRSGGDHARYRLSHLADGSGFVKGIVRFDGEAPCAQRFPVLAGCRAFRS
jgi:hypothetical protein